MINNKKVLAFIPARYGSKRLPKKNIRNLNGLPLISYTINAAKKCEYIDNILISSDSEKIINIALANGCDFDRRNPDLSSDKTKTIDVIKELITRKNKFDIIVTLQPTSPLRNSTDIKNALNLYEEKKANAVISVCKTNTHPDWINTLGNNSEMEEFSNNLYIKKDSQDLQNYYKLNGAIYCNNVDLIQNAKSLLFDKKTYAYIMPISRSVDIDTMNDFEYAEFLVSKNNILD